MHDVGGLLRMLIFATKLHGNFFDFSRRLILLLNDSDHGGVVAQGLILETCRHHGSLIFAWLVDNFESCYFEESFGRITNDLNKIESRKSQVDWCLCQRVFFRSKLKDQLLELCHWHDLRDQHRLVPEDLFQGLRRLGAPGYGAFPQTWLHSVLKSLDDESVELLAPVSDNAAGAPSSLRSAHHKILVAT